MFQEALSLSSLAAVVDIVIVAVFLYWVILMFKGTRAERMFWGLSVVVIMHFVSQRAELLTLHWLLSNFLGSIVIFIIVVFQQDIRRALVRMGKPFSFRYATRSGGLLDEVSRAVAAMADRRMGGLIVFERAVELSDFLGSGVNVDGEVSRDMLLSIFNTGSPVHDGAVLVKGGRLARAGCILPLTDRELAKGMGTRHRAAVGLAEETDAVIIVVSEQTGDVSLVVEGDIIHGVSLEDLPGRLKGLFTDENDDRKSIFAWRAGA